VDFSDDRQCDPFWRRGTDVKADGTADASLKHVGRRPELAGEPTATGRWTEQSDVCRGTGRGELSQVAGVGLKVMAHHHGCVAAFDVDARAQRARIGKPDFGPREAACDGVCGSMIDDYDAPA
jgi:hypothetical protein